METKKIKVKEVKHNREYKTQRGFIIHYFDLKDEDDNYYAFSSNTQDQRKFVPGKEYEVSVEIKQTRNGTYEFIDLSEAEKERLKIARGSTTTRGSSRPYFRSREELLSIVTQSSYEAAVLLCVKFVPENIKDITPLTQLAKFISTFVIESSGLDSEDCIKEMPAAMKTANNLSIIYQKAIKLAIQALDIPNISSKSTEPVNSTKGMLRLADEIAKDIIDITEKL